MIKNLFFIVLSVLLLSGCSGAASGEPLTRVSVAQGELEGVAEMGFGVFKAIPYAEPPVGDLRWKSPIPKAAWDGVLRTDSFAPMPPQQVHVMPGQSAPPVSEDCLYLSIITPAKSYDEKLPVMVWIHGGGFITGSYAQNPGFNLAEKGVIVAAIEYRTGALGFLSLPELSAESPDGISGNYGLQDQILGLKWIKENIRAFGGDPEKITIFGESAGAIAVSMLCASPEAKGLFERAICQSGGSFCPVDSVRVDNNSIRDLKGSEAFGLDFMRRMGANNLKELRKMAPEKWIDDAPTIGVGGFWPCVDGKYIVGDQYELYQRGEFNDVDLLIGTNSDEGSMFSHPSTVAEYEEEVRSSFGPFAEKILKAYPASSDEETFGARADIFRETAFAWPSYAWELLQGERSQKNIYVYYFDIPTVNPWMPTPSRGAMHAADVMYVFGQFFMGEPTDNDRKISDLMISYWTNFAKNGDPNGKGLPEWPKFKPTEKSVMHLQYGPDLITLPNLDKLHLMNEFFNWKRNTLYNSTK